MKKKLLIYLAAPIIGFLIIFLSADVMLSEEHTSYKGIVNAKFLNLRDLPSQDATILKVMSKGTEIDVVNKIDVIKVMNDEGSWLKINYLSRGELVTGYIKNRPEYVILTPDNRKAEKTKYVKKHSKKSDKSSNINETDRTKKTAYVKQPGKKADMSDEQGNYFHPFIALGGKYKSNVFQTATNEIEDYILTAQPGFWLAFPGSKTKLMSMSTSLSSAGGLQYTRILTKPKRKVQSYFSYSPKFTDYIDESTYDSINQNVLGMLQYNSDWGFSVEAVDSFNIIDEIGDDPSFKVDEYTDNLFSIITSYATSEIFKLRFDYSNYNIDYDETIQNYKDRQDNAFSVYLFYKLFPKTSVFAEYDFADIDYDSSIMDSDENRYYAGITWDLTAKTQSMLKLGYIDKDFDSTSLNDQGNFSGELQTKFTFTPKTSLNIKAFRISQESNLENSPSYISTGLNTSLTQKLTSKWSLILTGAFKTKDYNDNGGYDRNDDVFNIGPAIKFVPKRWLNFNFGYKYSETDSNINTNDYADNEIYITTFFSM